MRLTEGESKALVASSVLVLLAVLGRVLLSPPAAQVELSELREAGDADSALAVAESAFADVERRRAALAPGERIDPNVADEVELDRLPGIGPATARAIVRNRMQDGPFRALADLERVPGLGSNTVERLAGYVALPKSVERAHVVSAKLDLNRANQAELEALPGIGPARASAIVSWRDEHGFFQELEDLLQVPGIGPVTLERLRSQLTIGP